MSDVPLRAGPGDARWEIPPGLAVPRTSFIGRDDDLKRLESLLGDPDCRLVTVTGTGGVGKTRLALTLAARPQFVDRVGFVPLADVQDSHLVPATILRALGLEALPGQVVEDVVVASLRHRGALLVLDNLEHLSAAPVVNALLTHCPDLQILATSRVPLGIAGEQQYPLSPLGLPGSTVAAMDSAAVHLFVNRVRLVLPGFQVTSGNLDDVAQICQYLDGLPLAIELAAAHCRQLAPHVLAERLRQRVSLPNAGGRDAPARHQTMQATVSWSVNLLAPEIAQLWRGLGVFEGGFTVDAAEEVAVKMGIAAASVAPALDLLERHDLVQRGANSLGEPRYQMLQLTREVAMDALRADPHWPAIAEAHSDCFHRFAERVQPGLMGPDGMTWFARVEADLANIRAVLQRDLAAGEIVRPLRMVTWLHWFWTDPAYLHEGFRWLSTVVDSIDDAVPESLQVEALAVISSVAEWLNEHEIARVHATRALDLARRTGMRRAEMEVLLQLGNIYFDGDDLERAESHLVAGQALAQDLQDAWYMAGLANLIASVAYARGEGEASIGWFRAAASGWQAAGYASHVALAQCGLATTLIDLGRIDEAVAYARGEGEASIGWFRAAASGWQAAGYASHVALAQCGLATTLIDLGRIDEAVALLAEALGVMDGDDATSESTMAVAAVSGIAQAHGMPVMAVRYVAAAVHLRQQMGIEYRPYFARILTGRATELRGEISPADFSRAWSAGTSMTNAAAMAEMRSFLAELPAPVMLTSREREVLALLAAGASDGDIADHLYISRRTASKHVAAILEKLAAPNRTTAVAIAYRRGLVTP